MLKNDLNVMLNEIRLNEDDPTVIDCKFIILDFELSRNNVVVGRNEGLQLGETIKGKPIRTLYKESANPKNDDFGDHEAELSIDRNGNTYMKRNTVPIGVFTSNGYLQEVVIDNETKEVLVADAQLWYSQFKEPIQLLMEWFEQGLHINMSCEYLYSNYEVKNKIEYHYSPLYFESHVILGSQVTPAYKSAKLLQFNQLEEFSLAVAQALKDTKEGYNLEQIVQTNEEVAEEVVVDVETVEVAEEVAEEPQEVKEEVIEEKAEEVKEEVVEEPQVEVQENEEVAQLNAKVEELNNEISKLNTTIEDLTTAKLELSEKFNTATETIALLNAQIEELKPFKEQFELAQKETALKEAKEHFEAKFKGIGAEDVFASEEVQNLVAQSIEDGEVGLNAKLLLNEKIVELLSKKLEANENPIQAIMGVQPRDFTDVIGQKQDPLSEYRF